MVDAATFALDDRRHFRSGRRVPEDGEVEYRRRADDVVDADGEKRRAGSLIVEGEVDSTTCDWNTSSLRVDRVR